MGGKERRPHPPHWASPGFGAPHILFLPLSLFL